MIVNLPMDVPCVTVNITITIIVIIVTMKKDGSLIKERVSKESLKGGREREYG